MVYFFSFSSNDVKVSPSVVFAYDPVNSNLQLQITELETKLKECEKINNLKTDGKHSRYVKLSSNSSTKSDDHEKLTVEDIRAQSIADRYQMAKKKF